MYYVPSGTAREVASCRLWLIQYNHLSQVHGIPAANVVQANAHKQLSSRQLPERSRVDRANEILRPA